MSGVMVVDSNCVTII